MALVLFLFFLTRIGFYWYNKYLFLEIPLALWKEILRGGLRFDLAALFYLNGPYLLLALLPLPFVYSKGWQRFLKALFMVTNGAGFLVQLFDFVFFRTTLRRTDFTFFREFSNETHLGPLVLRALTDHAFMVVLWLVLTGFLWFGYGRSGYKSSKLPVRPLFTARFFMTRLFVWGLTAGLAVIAIRGGTDRTTRPITLSNATAYVRDPLQTGLVLNTPFCIIRTFGKPALERLDYFRSEEDLERIYTPVHRKEVHKEEVQTAYTEAVERNVVILILESFSKEYIGSLNEGTAPSYTPFLDVLAMHSLSCTKAYANGRKSVDAIPSILGSIPSPEQSFALTPYALNKVEGLGQALKKRNYTTAFFHGAPNGSMGLDGMARHFGFDAYYGMNEFGDNSFYDGYWGIWDEPFLQFFAATLDSFPQPFAAALFTLSSHHPFVIPKEYEGQFPEGTDPVHPCIGYADYALKQFFERAAESSWYEHTLFVLVADHGIFSRTNPLYQTASESMAIPLLYYDPSGTLIPEGAEYGHPTQQIDIMPTVLEWLNHPYSYFAFGRNIRDSLSFQEPDNELFLKAFRQQYHNRLLDDRLTVTD
ncbi:MAG: LTA synthase family protein [Bacteroidales bacterium]|nr:LTA synthase family protein [Bacteroidales bacterium]